MAKNISLLGADYPDVPAVVLPKTGGGSARFVDADDFTGNQYYIATAGPKFTINSSCINKIGKYVIGCVVASSTSSFGTTDVIATIPAEVRPNARQNPLYIEVPEISGIWCGSVSGSINTSGEIQQAVSSSFGSGMKLKIVFAYCLS